MDIAFIPQLQSYIRPHESSDSLVANGWGYVRKTSVLAVFANMHDAGIRNIDTLARLVQPRLLQEFPSEFFEIVLANAKLTTPFEAESITVGVRSIIPLHCRLL